MSEWEKKPFLKLPYLCERDDVDCVTRDQSFVSLCGKVREASDRSISVSFEQPSNENHTYYFAKSPADGQALSNWECCAPASPLLQPPVLPGFIKPFPEFTSAKVSPDPKMEKARKIEIVRSDYSQMTLSEVKNRLNEKLGDTPHLDIVAHWINSRVNKMAVTFEGVSQIFQKVVKCSDDD